MRVCMRDGEFRTALDVALSQEDPRPLLRCLCEMYEADEASGAPSVFAEGAAAVASLAPAVEALHGTDVHAPLVCVVLHYAGQVLRASGETSATTSAREDAERAVSSAITLALQSPSHAIGLLGPIARAAPLTMVDRVMSVADVAFRSKQYMDISCMQDVLRLVTQRKDLDTVVMLWWRWLQHTRLSLEPTVLSMMVDVLARNQKATEAAEVVHQLHALNRIPTPEAQLSYLKHLAEITRPPIPQAELLVNLWSQQMRENERHVGRLHWSLLQFHVYSGNAAVLRSTCSCLLRNHMGALEEDEIEMLLQRLLDTTAGGTTTARCDDDASLEALAAHVAVAKFAPTKAQRILTAALLANRANTVEVLGPWLEHCDNDVFEEALGLVASHSSKLALALCEVSHRVVPDTLQAWTQLLSEEEPGAPTT